MSRKSTINPGHSTKLSVDVFDGIRIQTDNNAAACVAIVTEIEPLELLVLSDVDNPTGRFETAIEPIELIPDVRIRETSDQRGFTVVNDSEHTIRVRAVNAHSLLRLIRRGVESSG